MINNMLKHNFFADIVLLLTYFVPMKKWAKLWALCSYKVITKPGLSIAIFLNVATTKYYPFFTPGDTGKPGAF
jgi:hypothetical protein